MDYSAASAGGAAAQQQQQQQHQYYQQYPQYQQAPYDPAQSQPYAAYYDPAAYQPYYAPAPQPQPQPQPDPQYAGPGAGTGDGMNPAAAAAVAALSQLTQFAGSMDAAERAAAEHGHQFPMRAPVGGRSVGGRSSYRGGGRRGGSVRGRRGGRGNFGQNATRQDGAPPPFRGRGRGRMGRGGGRHSNQSTSDTGPAGVVPSQPAQAPKPPQPKISFVAWCDICRADCNSLEILEQHKNGKRHKKTVKKLEEMQAQQRLMGELPEAVIPSPELPPLSNKALVPVSGPSNLSVASETPAANAIPAGVFEPNKVPAVSVNTPTSVPVTAHLAQNQTVAAEPTAGAAPLETATAEAQPTDVSKPGMEGNDQFDRRPGLKRKLTKFGRGGKRLKSYEPVRKSIEAPRFCATCNVMCDTQAVFECHLSGRKHITRVKRFQRPGLVFGPLSVYIPPNQPTASNGPEPVCYGLRSEDMPQIEAAALNDLPLVFSGPQQGDQASGAIEADGAAVVIPPERPQQGGQASGAIEADGAAVVIPPEQGSKHSGDEVLPPAGGEEDAPAAVAAVDVSLDAKGQEAVDAFLSEVDMLDVAPNATAAEAVLVPGNGAPPSDNVEEDPEEDHEKPTANEEAGTAVAGGIP